MFGVTSPVKPGASTRRVPTHGRLAEAVDIIGPGSKTRDVEAAQLPDNQCRWPVFGHLEKAAMVRSFHKVFFRMQRMTQPAEVGGVPSMMGSFNNGVPSQAIEQWHIKPIVSSFAHCIPQGYIQEMIKAKNENTHTQR